MKSLVFEVGSSLTQIPVLDCVIFTRLVNCYSFFPAVLLKFFLLQFISLLWFCIFRIMLSFFFKSLIKVQTRIVTFESFLFCKFFKIIVKSSEIKLNLCQVAKWVTLMYSLTESEGWMGKCLAPGHDFRANCKLFSTPAGPNWNYNNHFIIQPSLFVFPLLIFQLACSLAIWLFVSLVMSLHVTWLFGFLWPCSCPCM